MTPASLRDVLIAATAMSGLLAGASADRYLVQVPAWRHLDLMTWAEHSRHADLGNGRFWYPVLAFGATALSALAAFGVKAHEVSVSGLALPVYLGALLSAAGLGLTVLAAPNLLRLRSPKDRATTEAAFQAFHRWGLLRAICQIAAFPVTLWALRAFARLP